MTQVTDPALLAQLNGRTKVTDPTILAQLNGTEAPTPGLGDKLKNRLVNEFAGPARDSNYGFLDTMKNLGGAAGDVESSVASAFTPGVVKKYGKEAIDAAADTKAGRAGSAAARTVSKFENEHPSIGKPVRAIGSVFGATAGAEGLASGASLAHTGAEALRSKTADMAENLSKPAVKIPTHEELQKTARDSYDYAESKGAALKPAWTDKALNELNKLNEQTVEGRAIAGETPLSKLLAKSEALRGKPVTLKGAEEIDKALTNEITTHYVNGKLDGYGQQILDYQTKFREMIDKAGSHEVTGGKDAFDALKTGRAQWSQAARMRDIETIMNKLGSSPASIKNGFKALYNNPSRMRGFTVEEKAAIKKAATSGVVTDLLHVLSNKGIAVIHAATGGGLGSSALTYGGNRLAGSAEEALHLRRGQKVADLVANRKIPGVGDAMGSEVDPLAKPLALPAPKSEFIVDETGKARMQTPAERDAAISGRQRLSEIGLTPDVMKAQEVKQAGELMQKYGQSELGKFVAENANKPISRQMFDIPRTEYSEAETAKMLRNADWDKLDRIQQKKIQLDIQKAWNAQKQSIAEMILEARKKAQYLAEAKGEVPPSTAMSEALKNAKVK